MIAKNWIQQELGAGFGRRETRTVRSPTLMVTPEGQALGVIDAWTWTRKAKGEDDIKESHRWIEGYGIVADRAQSQPNTRFVTVADRKADIQELMEEARRRDYAADYLIRAKHNRNLVGGEKLWDSIASQEPLIHTRSHPAAQSMSNPVRPTGDSAQEKVIASSAKTLWEGMEKIWHYGIEIEILEPFMLTLIELWVIV